LNKEEFPISTMKKGEEIAIESWRSRTEFPEALPGLRRFFFRNGFVETADSCDPTGKGGMLIYSLISQVPEA